MHFSKQSIFDLIDIEANHMHKTKAFTAGGTWWFLNVNDRNPKVIALWRGSSQENIQIFEKKQEVYGFLLI